MKVLFFIIFFFSILSTVNAQSMSSKNIDLKKEVETPMIIVMSLKISKNNNQVSVSITSSRIVNSVKKLQKEKSNKWNENDLVCFILDENKKVLDTLVLIQPLKGRYEYPNSNGTLEYKHAELSENELLLRMPFRKSMKFMCVAQVGPKRKLSTLTTLLIPTEK